MQAEILIKNPKWQEGEPDNQKFFAFPIPDGEGGAEFRVNAQGYSVYFDRKEERTVGLVTNSKEERTVHTEIFFNVGLEQVGIWKRYTDWEPSELDKSVITHAAILPVGRMPARAARRFPKPS